MVRETRNGTGQQGYLSDITEDAEALQAHPLPPDTDRDGISDAWEAAHGLDKSNPSDAGRVSPSGYTHLELYCHELANTLIQEAASAAN
jgi:hypothetical protein